jgi:glycosyltransferase involved in cell wall biosynthesis
MPNPFLSLIIPAHNEAQRLPDTLQQVLDFLQSQAYTAEILVIENASQDDTLAVAEAFAAQHPRLRVLHSELGGKGRAIQRGMLEARGAYRFMCDADLSMPITELSRFLPAAAGQALPTPDYDIAIGSREAPGAVRYNEPLYRHLGGRAINLAIRLLALPGIQDSQCGFKCFSAAAAESLFRKQTLMGFSFDVEILYLARKQGLRISEVPIQWYFKAGSKVSPVRDALRMLQDVLRVRRNDWQGRYK